jgi:hypothetical protein
MPLDQLSDQEKEALAIGERLEQQEQERDKFTYEEAHATEQETLQFAGKFRTVEDLEKGYLELQKKLGSKETEKPEPTEETTEEETDEQQQTQPEQDEVQGREEETRKPEAREEVPQLTKEDEASILQAIGGQEAYNSMIAWGAENLSEADRDAYNQVLASGNAPAIKLATEGLMARYLANADFQGQPVRGRPGSSEPGAKPYRSRAEVNAAMSDYRYEADPAYRNDVMARLAASPDDLL